MSRRPVFLADSTMVSTSMGTRVRRSTTSASMPSAASSAAAASARSTIPEYVTIVASAPARFTSAWPNGMRYSSSGTGSFSARIMTSRCV